MKDDGYLDLSDHDSFSNGVPHNTFERIRKEDPVCWTEEINGRGFWSITKHADILKINNNNKVFSSAKGIRIEDQTEEEYLARRTFQIASFRNAPFSSKCLSAFASRQHENLPIMTDI